MEAGTEVVAAVLQDMGLEVVLAHDIQVVVDIE